jgi:hypothetical protein
LLLFLPPSLRCTLSRSPNLLCSPLSAASQSTDLEEEGQQEAEPPVGSAEDGGGADEGESDEGDARNGKMPAGKKKRRKLEALLDDIL